MVVDFVVVHLNLTDKVLSLSVGKYAPFLSEHCPIFFELRTATRKINESDTNLKESTMVYKIRDEDRLKL